MNTHELLRLGQQAQDNGQWDRAIDCYGKALQEQLRIFGEYHPEVSFIYNNLGNAWYQKGAYDRAASHRLQALKGLHRVCSADHPLLAETCDNLARALSGLGEHDKAIQYYERAVRIYRRAGMKDRAQTVEKEIGALFARIKPKSQPVS